MYAHFCSEVVWRNIKNNNIGIHTHKFAAFINAGSSTKKPYISHFTPDVRSEDYFSESELLGICLLQHNTVSTLSWEVTWLPWITLSTRRLLHLTTDETVRYSRWKNDGTRLFFLRYRGKRETFVAEWGSYQASPAKGWSRLQSPLLVGGMVYFKI